MPKEEWGTKRLCPATGKRFYDLNKSPIVSPYSGEVVNLDTGSKTRSALSDRADRAEKKPEKEVETKEAAEEVLVDDDDDADVDLEDDLLDDDEDDTVALDDIADVATNDDD